MNASHLFYTLEKQQPNSKEYHLPPAELPAKAKTDNRHETNSTIDM